MGTLVFQANLGGAVNLIGPNTASTVNFTLPSADGTSGQALVTNGSGTLSFSTFTSGAAGSNTQVQFNSSGAFAGSANLTFDGTTLTSNALTVTNATTLSAGTANGVAYLNGSKVVTTGSALTFDGTNLGLSSSAVATAIKIDGSGRYKQFETYQSGSREFYFGYDSTSLIGLIYQDNNRPIAFGISGSEAMRLTSTGLGIGTTSPGTKLDVRGVIQGGDGTIKPVISYTGGAGEGVFGTLSNHPVAFYTNSTERARIDSSGNLLVGTSGSGLTSNVGIKMYPDGRMGCVVNDATTGTNSYHLYNTNATNNGYRFYVNVNGGINNYSANNVNLSDRREKTDFAPAGQYLAKICSIPVQTFKYIGQDDDALTLGVVAQDVEAVAPELVTEVNWGTEEEPKMRLSIYQTDLQYALMKCIQEQQAIIEQLKADVAALKGN